MSDNKTTRAAALTLPDGEEEDCEDEEDHNIIKMSIIRDPHSVRLRPTLASCH